MAGRPAHNPGAAHKPGVIAYGTSGSRDALSATTANRRGATAAGRLQHGVRHRVGYRFLGVSAAWRFNWCLAHGFRPWSRGNLVMCDDAVSPRRRASIIESQEASVACQAHRHARRQRVGKLSRHLPHFVLHTSSAMPRMVDCARACPPYRRSGHIWRAGLCPSAWGCGAGGGAACGQAAERCVLVASRCTGDFHIMPRGRRGRAAGGHRPRRQAARAEPARGGWRHHCAVRGRAP
jgi:hypothetical protein